MDDFINDENLPVDRDPAEPTRRTGRTGPVTPHGKAKSSQNRLTHGCRSEKTLLPDEDPEEFEFTVECWFTHYEPEDTVAYTLVQETARAHWVLKRNQKRVEGVEWELPSDPNAWTDNDHKKFTNFSRYKTTAERAFFRLFKEVEAYYGRLDRAENLRERARDQLIRFQMQWIDQRQKGMPKELTVEQYVEAEVIEGQTKTSYYPSNQELIKEAAERRRLPIFFERYISFPNGVPPEYEWTRANDFQKCRETMGVQKMSYKMWLDLIEREAASGSNHVGPLVPLPSNPHSEPRS